MMTQELHSLQRGCVFSNNHKTLIKHKLPWRGAGVFSVHTSACPLCLHSDISHATANTKNNIMTPLLFHHVWKLHPKQCCQFKIHYLLNLLSVHNPSDAEEIGTGMFKKGILAPEFN